MMRTVFSLAFLVALYLIWGGAWGDVAVDAAGQIVSATGEKIFFSILAGAFWLVGPWALEAGFVQPLNR